LNRSPNESDKGMKSRLRKKQPLKTVEISPIEDDWPRKEEVKKSGRRGRPSQSRPVRRASRTPSLSPSRLEGLGEENTPEMVFETSRRASQDSDFEMDEGNDNLSQLVSLMDESG